MRVILLSSKQLELMNPHCPTHVFRYRAPGIDPACPDLGAAPETNIGYRRPHRLVDQSERASGHLRLAPGNRVEPRRRVEDVANGGEGVVGIVQASHLQNVYHARQRLISLTVLLRWRAMTSLNVLHVDLDCLPRMMPEDAHIPRTVINPQVRRYDRVRPTTTRKTVEVLQHRELPEVLAHHVWPARPAKAPRAAEHVDGVWKVRMIQRKERKNNDGQVLPVSVIEWTSAVIDLGMDTLEIPSDSFQSHPKR